jgi:hypothetical protein
MEKQHNRGQDGGFASIKLDVEAGNVTLVVYVRIMHNLFKMFLLK